MTLSQIYTETEGACKYPKLLFKTQNSVKYEKNFDMKTGKLIFDPISLSQDRENEKSYNPTIFYKNTGQTGGKVRPENEPSTRLK